MSTKVEELILKFSCEDQPGIVAAVAGLFSLQGFNIREASQFEDVEVKRFFMRTLLESVEGPKSSVMLPVLFNQSLTVME